MADGSEDILGLFILLDGLDEAATKRGMILEYLKSLLETEPCHFPMLTSRPGVLGFAEQEQLAFLGFVACFMGRLSLQNCLGLAESILKRAREPESRIQKLLVPRLPRASLVHKKKGSPIWCDVGDPSLGV